MTSKKYRKKPVIIEALQWTGENIEEMDNFINCKYGYTPYDNAIYVPTLEGEMKADINDYIIKGVKGEFYPCKPDIFNKTYEEI